MSSISISSGLGESEHTRRPVKVRKYRAGRGKSVLVSILFSLFISLLFPAPPSCWHAVPGFCCPDRVFRKRRCKVLPSISCSPITHKHLPALAGAHEPYPGAAAVGAEAIRRRGGLNTSLPRILDFEWCRGQPLSPSDESLAVPDGNHGVVHRSIEWHLLQKCGLPSRITGQSLLALAEAA